MMTLAMLDGVSHTDQTGESQGGPRLQSSIVQRPNDQFTPLCGSQSDAIQSQTISLRIEMYYWGA